VVALCTRTKGSDTVSNLAVCLSPVEKERVLTYHEQDAQLYGTLVRDLCLAS